ncbi:uncharacterized protein TRAVEDRAFT_23447 [Trametes versicolor FP-101664 SS1]|uniref:uncharacterized protein n=1 Tax=Trametes versicolor (strain FP-101664) TaxID=717944 RepID=UPI000462473E|nr:uncharacterized protein TRAVEDRAFT_23447 [Trametes versicolor FP-101664 SS1]EIW54349.1 hypothetical protein TRAVEDRAFT_23447 [Trametes versicolor FP-101664 SS1]
MSSTTESNEGSVDRSLSEARLIACFNSEITQVTAETLLRWIGMPAALRLSGEVVLKKVSLEHQGKFRYKLVPLKLLESSEILEAGVYGYYFPGPRGAKPIIPALRVKTFKQHREETLQYLETTPHDHHKWFELEHHNVQDDDVRAEVKIPHNRCIFTGFMSSNAVPQYGADGGHAVAQDVTDASGATIGGPTAVAIAGSTDSASAEGVDLRWILPRDMRDTNGAVFLWRMRSVDIVDIPLTEAANVLPMRDAVHELWFANEFSVDVDDEYRIYTFTEAATKAGLPERLSLPAEAVSSHFYDIYLREHMLHTLLLRVNGGAFRGVWALDENASEWYDEEEQQVEAVTDAMTELQISKDDGM